MSLIHENLNIIATLASAWAVYYFLRKPICKVETRLEKLEEKVNSLDSRIARIEGQLMHFEPRWEPRFKEKQE